VKHRTSDVIIVGAGVSGLSVAVHLKGLGVPKVTVLERHFVGAGQSGRAAGVVRALVNHKGVASMLMESLGFFQTFHEKYDGKVPASPPPHLGDRHAVRRFGSRTMSSHLEPESHAHEGGLVANSP